MHEEERRQRHAGNDQRHELLALPFNQFEGIKKNECKVVTMLGGTNGGG